MPESSPRRRLRRVRPQQLRFRFVLTMLAVAMLPQHSAFGTSGAATRAVSVSCRAVPARLRPRRCARVSMSAEASTEREATAAAPAAVAVGTSEQPAIPKTQRILSGVQPTGTLHLGNYLGAVKQWVDFQKDGYENYFCAVDLHAITVPHDPKKLRTETLQAAATYLAAGVDPKRSKIFVQSHVSAHAEMTWLLNCVTPINWLERMIQFKEKARKQGDSVGVGLFGYPVLMAADILLYQADLVPVGEDQRQHLELTRDIARRFNDQFCRKQKTKTFKEFQALIVKDGARVMSLQEGTCKMSKSDPNDGSRINLLDSADVIVRKVKKCKTDAFQGLEWDNPERPECKNLLTIYQAVTGLDREAVLADVGGMSWGAFKPLLAEAVVAHLSPLQARYAELIKDPQYLGQVLGEGADAADKIASKTLESAMQAMGFCTRKSLRSP